MNLVSGNWWYWTGLTGLTIISSLNKTKEMDCSGANNTNNCRLSDFLLWLSVVTVQLSNIIWTLELPIVRLIFNISFPGILMSLFSRIFKRNQTKWRVNLDINYICRQKNLNFLNKTSSLIFWKVERKESFMIGKLE